LRTREHCPTDHAPLTCLYLVIRPPPPDRAEARPAGRCLAGIQRLHDHLRFELVGRTFTRGCDLDITSLAPYLKGVELAELVPQLAAIPDKANWSIRLRRPLVRLSEQDATLLRRALAIGAQRPPGATLEEYLDKIKPVAGQSR
jgi:hypothetical protein